MTEKFGVALVASYAWACRLGGQYTSYADVVADDT
jgi:hypothetical protein